MRHLFYNPCCGEKRPGKIAIKKYCRKHLKEQLASEYPSISKLEELIELAEKSATLKESNRTLDVLLELRDEGVITNHLAKKIVDRLHKGYLHADAKKNN